MMDEMTSAMAWRAYLELCKPKVVTLMLVTALVGMLLSVESHIPWGRAILGIIGIGLCASAAAVINHLLDRRIDAIMSRTKHRPLPSGKITVSNALIFAAVLTFVGMTILIQWINSLTAILTFATLVGYAVIYTRFLKHATPQNIVIGGIAGAAPPLLGWTAMTGQFNVEALLLMAIIFVWTPPHFWALAIYRFEEYKQANIPMLPVKYGIPYTKLNILVYTILLTIITLVPYIIGMSGLIYLMGAIVLNLIFLYWAIKLWRSKNIKVALNTFRYSIFYLFLLFVILLIDHYL